MSDTSFTAKERLRFRKLLEVANSTTYAGERDAALNAATRLATSHGMSLREAAGMADAPEKPDPNPREHPRRAHGFAADFGAAGTENVGKWWRTPHRGPGSTTHGFHTDNEILAAEKQRHAKAMADAIGRGLDAAERKAADKAAKARATMKLRPGKRGSWRARPEFIRVLLTETAMTAKEIAAAAGVTVHEVFREKLLMRKAG